MTVTKTKFINFTSPRGTAKYPKTDKPYSWSNAQNRSVADPDGQYELVLLMSEGEAKTLKATLKEAIDESGIKPQNVPFKKEVDKDTDAETGNVEVKFKAYGKRKDGTVNKIKFVDAKLNPLPSSFKLTSGSIVKVDGYISVAKLGARFNIRGVQVINLAADSYGTSFEAEDGYEYDGEEEEITTETTVGTSKQTTDDDELDF